MRQSEIYERGSGNYTCLYINIDGLDSVMRYLNSVDQELAKMLRDELKDAAQPVLDAARANARTFAASGDFMNSLSLRAYKNGAVRLKSSDPAAGVIEFAKWGAVTITSKGTPRANARLAKKSGVGVPWGSRPPRAMYKAINEKSEEVKRQMDVRIERVLERA